MPMTGTGYGAVNLLTPSEAMDAAARASTLATQSQLASATLGDQIQTADNAAQASGLNLSSLKLATQAHNAATGDQLIARAAAQAQDPQTWDEAMQELADNGVPAARQFIGRYSERLKGQIATGYSAGTPGGMLSALQSDNPTGMGGADSGLSGMGGNAGMGVSSGAEGSPWDAQLGRLSVQQLQPLYQKTESVRNAIQAVANSPMPAAEWDRQAQAMGHPEWVGHYSPMALQQLAQETVPLDNYLRGRLTREEMGAPAPVVPAKMDNVGGVLYSVDTTDPAHPKATPMTPQGKGTLVGTDPDTGVGVYYDPVTGQETKGTIKLAAKPGGSGPGGRMSVFQQKQQAWLAVHPGDNAGALQYANSLQGKNLSDEQLQVAATKMAASELSALTLAGTPPKDGDAFLEERSAQLAQQIKSGTAGGGPSAKPPASALAQLKEGQVTTFANGQQWTKKNGQPVRVK